MTLSDTQVIIALLLSLFPAILAINLGSALYKNSGSSEISVAPVKTAVPEPEPKPEPKPEPEVETVAATETPEPEVTATEEENKTDVEVNEATNTEETTSEEASNA